MMVKKININNPPYPFSPTKKVVKLPTSPRLILPLTKVQVLSIFQNVLKHFYYQNYFFNIIIY